MLSTPPTPLLNWTSASLVRLALKILVAAIELFLGEYQWFPYQEQFAFRNGGFGKNASLEMRLTLAGLDDSGEDSYDEELDEWWSSVEKEYERDRTDILRPDEVHRARLSLGRLGLTLIAIKSLC